MADTTLEVLISARDQFTPTANRVIGTLGRMKTAAAGVAGGLGRMGTGFAKLAATAAVGIGLLATQFKAGLDSLIELDRLQRQTEAVLKSTGNAAGLTAADIRALAEEYENLSTIDDKVIQGAANVLLTFPAIRKEAFEPTLAAALDLSVALGTDLQGAVIQVGKALQDPVRGLTALRRVGVAFSEQQEDRIKLLVEEGELYEAQKMILAELAKEFGGSAGAFGQSTEGRINRVGDAIEDAQKALATGMLPVVERIADRLRTRLTDPIVLASIEQFGRSIAGLFSDENLDAAERFLGGMVDNAGKMAAAFRDHVLPVLRAALDLIGKLPDEVKAAGAALLILPKIPGVADILGGAAQIGGALGGGLARGAAARLPGVGGIFAQPVFVTNWPPGTMLGGGTRGGAIATTPARGGFLGTVSLLGSVVIAGVSIAALAEQIGVFAAGVGKDQADLQAKADAAALQTGRESVVNLRALADTLSKQNVFERLITEVTAETQTLTAIENLSKNLLQDQSLGAAELRAGLASLERLQQYANETFGQSLTEQSQIGESIDQLRARLLTQQGSLTAALSGIADRPINLTSNVNVNLDGRQVTNATVISQTWQGEGIGWPR